MYYNLPKGTKIIFRDTPNNRLTLLGEGGDEEEYDYNGFELETTYEVGGTDGSGKCYFYDGLGHCNYGGMAVDGSSGDFEILTTL